jgi:hypothetical protein
MLDRINDRRADANQPKLQYADLAKAIRLSKQTVSALLNGHFSARTKRRHLIALHDHLSPEFGSYRAASQLSGAAADGSRAAGEQPAPSIGKTSTGCSPSPRKRQSRPSTKRQLAKCSTTGYITWKGKSYYAGPHFSGMVCRIAKGGEPNTIKIKCGTAQRHAFAIDATINHLGYAPPACLSTSSTTSTKSTPSTKEPRCA